MEKLAPLRLYLMRHPETEDNRTGRFAGLRDSAPTPQGVSQAQATARYLQHARLSAILSSPSRRALSLATALQAATDQASMGKATLHIVPELQERSFGEWDGLTFSEAQSLTPEAMQAWIDDPICACPPGGESLAQCAQRLQPLAEWLMKVSDPRTAESTAPLRHSSPPFCMRNMPLLHSIPRPSGSVAIVSHGAALRILLILLLRLPLDTALKLSCDHAAINIVELYGIDQAVLCRLNDISHIAPASTAEHSA